MDINVTSQVWKLIKLNAHPNSIALTKILFLHVLLVIIVMEEIKIQLTVVLENSILTLIKVHVKLALRASIALMLIQSLRKLVNQESIVLQAHKMALTAPLELSTPTMVLNHHQIVTIAREAIIAQQQD